MYISSIFYKCNILCPLIVSLADQMRLLNYSRWMELMENVFNNLLTIIHRAKVQDLVHIMLG